MKLRFHQKLWLVILTLSILASGCVSSPTRTLEPLPSADTQTQVETLSPTLTLAPQLPILTQTELLPPVPQATYDPYAYEVSLEIKEGASNETIAKALVSRWLDHLTSEEVDAEFRLQSYEITQAYNPSYLAPCAERLGALFVLDVGAEIETTDPMVCMTECEHSAWAAGGGTIVDAYHEKTAFHSAVFKSGDIYTLKVINADPPC